MFGSLIGTIAFIVGGAALFFAVVWSDMCRFLDTITATPSDYIPGMPGQGLEACFKDVPLILAFNMTKQLDFAGVLGGQMDELSANPDMVSAGFDAIKSPLSEFKTTISAFPLSDGWSGFSEATNAMSSVGDDCTFSGSPVCCYNNEYPTYTDTLATEPWTAWDESATSRWGESYGRQNGGTENAVDYITRLYSDSNCHDDVNAGIVQAFSALNTFVVAREGMLDDLDEMNSAFDSYQGKLEDLFDEIIGMSNSAIGDTIEHVNTFYCNMKCGFIRDFYEALMQTWCTDLLAGFMNIALALLLLAIFNFPICVCSAVLVNRFRNKWRCGSCAGADEGGRGIGKGVQIAPEDESARKEEEGTTGSPP